MEVKRLEQSYNIGDTYIWFKGEKNTLKNKLFWQKNKGITLIALVVTIVVLLILAGITITTVLGDNGIIIKAQEVEKETIISTVKESIEIEKLSKSLEKENGLITEDELKAILENYGEIKYDESGEVIKGIIENQKGYEILLPNIMEGVLDQNIYVKLYEDGTLTFSSNKDTIIEGAIINEDYGNIKGKKYSNWLDENNVRLSDTPWFNNAKSIIKVNIIDKIFPLDMSNWFICLENLVEIENIKNIDTSECIGMDGVFFNCNSLETIDVSTFNTYKVTTMHGMFGSDTSMSLKNINGLENLDTTNVTDFAWMFYNCDKLEKIDVSNFNTANATTMRSMFEDCSSLKELDLSNFITNKVDNMKTMFRNCSGLTKLNLKGLSTNNIKDMSYMFQACSNLVKLDLSSFITTNVTNMEKMFNNCNKLQTLNLSNFDTSNVVNMSAMFAGSTEPMELKEIIGLEKFDTSKVETMKWMFQYCVNFEILDLSNFDTHNVIDISYMFNHCRNLSTIYVGENWNLSNVTAQEGTFNDCGTETTITKTPL